jgi:hypothetical protein
LAIHSEQLSRSIVACKRRTAILVIEYHNGDLPSKGSRLPRPSIQVISNGSRK